MQGLPAGVPVQAAKLCRGLRQTKYFLLLTIRPPGKWVFLAAEHTEKTRPVRVLQQPDMATVAEALYREHMLAGRVHPELLLWSGKHEKSIDFTKRICLLHFFLESRRGCV
jgi:hypothetical protein